MPMHGTGPRTDGGEDASSAFESKHAAIIARTLRWADEAAARRDYLEALRWIETVRSVGETAPGGLRGEAAGLAAVGLGLDLVVGSHPDRL